VTFGKGKVTKPLPTGRQAFRLSVKVTCKELSDDKRNLLLAIRASLPLPVNEAFIFYPIKAFCFLENPSYE
jgi:hypothetical protein